MRTFGKYPMLPTAEESFKDGYDTGLSWDADWTPGGPFSYNSGRLVQDSDWTAHCEATVENRRAWLNGWRKGFEDGSPHVVRARLKAS